MKIIEKNLRQFINPPKDILEKTNSFITEVEEFKALSEINNLVIGYVLEKEKHENADTLSVLQVDLGNGIIDQIVCGAANVDKGQYVIIAKVGAVLPGDFVIKKSKIRGVESNGMVCSLTELGIDEKSIPAEFKDGIYYFSEPKEIGSDALIHLDLDGFIMELSLTPNRSDLLSYYGYAQDLAAVLDTKITLPTFEVKESNEKNPLTVTINSINTNSYNAKYLKDIEVKESPWWLKVILTNIGCQPINNVVDITNYILFTYGIPTHAFDAVKFGSKDIVINDNNKSAVVKTLDGQNIELKGNEIVITNGTDTMAIGGVMGLENSMITNETKEVIFELASFDAKTISNVSKQLNLKSESSLRFERGIDESIMNQALEHAMFLLQKYANATILNGVTSVVKKTKVNPKINIDAKEISNKIGITLTEVEILDILNRLKYNIEKTKDAIIVQAPSFRHDILEDYDVLEEVVRLYGMDQVKNQGLKVSSLGSLSLEQKQVRKLRHYLANVGFNEIVTYSLQNEASVQKFNELGEIISIIKPLTVDRRSLRQSLINGLLDNVKYNKARSINEVNVFEIGHVYAKGIEDNYLSAALTSPLQSNLWKNLDNKIDFYTLSGILGNVMDILNVEYNLEASSYEKFHPYQQANIIVNKEVVGKIGLVHPKEMAKETFVFEINLSKIKVNNKMKYEAISKYPNIERDIAIVIKEEIILSEVIRLVKQTAKKQLIDLKVFDVYQGEHIEKGFKSVGIRLVFNDSNKTLETADVEKIINKIIKRIEFELDGSLRN